MYVFTQFCVHCQQPPISSQIKQSHLHQKSPDCNLEATERFVESTIAFVARLCHQLRSSPAPYFGGQRKQVFKGTFRAWWTERELQEALGHMPRACEKKAASLLAPSA